MILRVGVLARFPDDLFAVNHLAVHHCADFAIRSPQIEPNPAAIQVPPKRCTHLHGRGNFFGSARDNFEGLLIHQIAHEMGVKRTDSGGGIAAFQMFSDAVRTAHIDLEGAALPEQEFEQALGVQPVGLRPGMALG